MSEEAKDQINRLINGIGAVCEIAGFIRRQLIEQGFTKAEAFRICESFILEKLESKPRE